MEKSATNNQWATENQNPIPNRKEKSSNDNQWTSTNKSKESFTKK